MAAAASSSAECHILALPEELLDHLAVAVCASLDGPFTLTVLSRTCNRLSATCTNSSFVELCGQLLYSRQGIASLEQLAVLEAYGNLGTTRVVFLGADTGIRPGSLARLEEFAQLMRRHPRLNVTIEAHTGRNAPPTFAPAFTRMRARRVGQHLLSNGVPSGRIKAVNGWGKSIAIAAGWQPGVESARAELYFTLDGLTFPERPSYYDGLAPPVGELLSDEEDASEMSADDDSDSYEDSDSEVEADEMQGEMQGEMQAEGEQMSDATGNDEAVENGGTDHDGAST